VPELIRNQKNSKVQKMHQNGAKRFSELKEHYSAVNHSFLSQNIKVKETTGEHYRIQ
jgi:DNA-binding HxlR family transcriptional regulator